MSRPQAAIVVTGSELVRGEREDRNGPFLAAEAVRLGLEPTRIAIVGDGQRISSSRSARASRPISASSRAASARPTTTAPSSSSRASPVGRSCSTRLSRARSAVVSRTIADRLGRPYADFTHGVRKQATRPEGAISLGLAGTAPGLVLDLDERVVVVLPGPPRELQRLWPRALETEPVRRVLARAPQREHRVLRFFGTPESAVAEALAAAGGEGRRRRRDDLRARVRDPRRPVRRAWLPSNGRGEVDGALRGALGRYLFGEDERSIAEIVLDLCRARGLTLATAESCTGGMVAARLTAVPGVERRLPRARSSPMRTR